MNVNKKTIKIRRTLPLLNQNSLSPYHLTAKMLIMPYRMIQPAQTAATGICFRLLTRLLCIRLTTAKLTSSRQNVKTRFRAAISHGMRTASYRKKFHLYNKVSLVSSENFQTDMRGISFSFVERDSFMQNVVADISQCLERRSLHSLDL